MSEKEPAAGKEPPPGHDMPWHTEACFQASRVIDCNDKRDRRECLVCHKTWEEACNFEEEFS